VFCAASLAYLISSRFGRLSSLRLGGYWGVVLKEGLNGQEHCVSLGGEGLKKILQGQKRAGKEAKSFIFVLFDDKVPVAEIRASFPEESQGKKQRKGKGSLLRRDKTEGHRIELFGT